MNSQKNTNRSYMFCIKCLEKNHNICEEYGCRKRPCYGKPNNKVTHCSIHRKKGMITNPDAKCCNCNQLATWGINWIRKHCDNHKTPYDKDLSEQECISCDLLYILDDDNKCENCNPHSFIKSLL